MNKLAKKVIAGVTIVLSSFAASSVAKADIVGPTWNVTAMSLSSGVNSNQVGFWQALLFSNGVCNVVDGNFGSQTVAATVSFQSGVLSYPQPGKPADGVVGWITWGDTQAAQFYDGVGYTNRLQNYGAGYWSYYGGGASGAELWWPGGSTGQWEFQHPGNGIYYYATNARTIPSADPC